ncbi:DNA/RNA nuclease SfsA [Glaciecola petra]|uniref:Sugar fermentation stimulation protein homolog n=1 Tax=Glaciecola petra TaxID=3075602 RepID=A0ABU2ZSR7_9ALTE|nr:DNA/RNA nuclease SfsA [Aestuariibacter sp. P117]MDT0595460.1 DNA/RNA nuclease SfsA [Aestuariibacter sp. P117]
MHEFSAPLTAAKLIKRYKRFLADVYFLPELQAQNTALNKVERDQMTVHCPNTGAMTGCQDQHSTVYLSKSANPKRKYAYTWEYATDEHGHKICVNTTNANRVVEAALENHSIAELSLYGQVIPEQKVNNSRIDFLLKEDGFVDCYLEVKSATLAEQTTAMFPDTVTKRGQKHCYELAQLAQQNHKAVLLFCVMRENITHFKIAESIDPDYAKAVKFAVDKGVELLCYGCELDLNGIRLSNRIPIIF